MLMYMLYLVEHLVSDLPNPIGPQKLFLLPSNALSKALWYQSFHLSIQSEEKIGEHIIPEEINAYITTRSYMVH